MRLPADIRRFAIVIAVSLVSLLATLPAAGARVRNFIVAQQTVTNHDHTALDEDVVINGQMNGDIQLVGGTLTVNGPVNGDIVTLGTDVTFTPHGRVDGDVVVIGGSITGASEANVSGEIVVKASESQAGTDVSLRSLGKLSMLSIALQLLLLGAWLIATILTTLVAGKEVRVSSQELRASPLHTFLLGLVAFTSLILTLVVLSFLIPYFVGVPLIIVVSAIAMVAKIYGMITVFHAIGSWLFGARRREDLQRREWLRGDLALAVLGLVVLGAVRLIPIAGTFVWMMASVFGVGSALATKFGRREPWFLAVRQISY